jgi:hypothetical protein
MTGGPDTTGASTWSDPTRHSGHDDEDSRLPNWVKEIAPCRRTASAALRDRAADECDRARVECATAAALWERARELCRDALRAIHRRVDGPTTRKR